MEGFKNKWIGKVSVLMFTLIFLVTPIFSDSEKAHANSGQPESVNLLENPSFEQLDGNAPISWGAKDNWASGSITLSSEAARTGDKGVKIETQTSSEFNVRQNVVTPINGGETYELSAWIKGQIPESGYAIMKIEFFRDTLNAAGYLGGLSSEQFGTYEEWEKINMYVTTPADANRAQVFLRLYGPGMVYYDDISFHQVDYIPGVNIHADRLFYYDDLTQGTVSGTVGPADGNFADKIVDVEIYPQEGGNAILSDSVPAVANFQYNFDPQIMELREPYILEVTLRTEQGLTLFQDSEIIYRWERPEALREDGAIMVDGEPFFPVIGYHLRVGDYSKVNEVINTVQGIRRKADFDTIRFHLDHAHDNELKVILPLYPDMDNLQGPEGIPYVQEIINEFKEHPAILGWMIYDEPDLKGIPLEKIAEVYREIRTIDSVNPTYMVVVYHDFYEEYFRATDIAVTDTYPLPDYPITRVGSGIDRATGLFPEKPVLAILQAFHWPPNYPHMPTITEVRHMAYQSVLNGAQGLGYYSFIDPGWELIDSELYPGILEFANKELPYFADFVLKGEQIGANQDEGVQWGLWEYDDKLYAMAINLTGDAQIATIPLPESSYHVEVIAPEYRQSNTNQDFTIELSGLESALIQFTPYTSSDDMKMKVERLADEGAFANPHAARSLSVHLTALHHYEQLGETSKLVEHMEGFMRLLKHQQENELITKEAYDSLVYDAELLVKQKAASILRTSTTMERIDVVMGETARVHVQLDNIGEDLVRNVVVNVQWPQAFGISPEQETISILNPGESDTVVMEVEILDGTAAGNYMIPVEVSFNYQGVDMGYTREKELTVHPLIDVYSLKAGGYDRQAVHATAPGEYPISFTLQNNSAEMIDVHLEMNLNENIYLDGSSQVQIAANQAVKVEGSIVISEVMAEGEYPLVVRVMVGVESLLDIPITVHYTRNLLQNPGFELEDEDLTPAGWSIGRSGQWVQDEVYSGQYAATLFADSENTWNVMHSRGFIPVKLGKTYRLGGWIKLAEGGNVDIGIRQLDENNQTISYTWETIEGQSDWAYYEMEITPAENTVSIQATSLMRHQYEHQAWFDDFRIEEVIEVAPRNLLENPGFEEGDNAPTGWYLGSGQWVQDEVRSGQYAITIIPDSGNTWNVMHSRGFIPVKSETAYRLSGWIKLAGEGNVDFGIRQLDENNQTVSYTWEKVDGHSNWGYYEMEIIPAENTSSIQAAILMRHQYEHQAWFDDLRIEEIIDES